MDGSGRIGNAMNDVHLNCEMFTKVAFTPVIFVQLRYGYVQ